MTQDEVNAAEWTRPENWHGGALGVYASRRDTRTLVPKRRRAMGWTLNLGRPSGRAAALLFAGGLLAAAALAAVGL